MRYSQQKSTILKNNPNRLKSIMKNLPAPKAPPFDYNKIKVLKELSNTPLALPLLFFDGLRTTDIPNFSKSVGQIENEEKGYFKCLCQTFVQRLLDSQYSPLDANFIKRLHFDCIDIVDSLSKQPLIPGRGVFTDRGKQHYSLPLAPRFEETHARQKYLIQSYFQELEPKPDEEDIHAMIGYSQIADYSKYYFLSGLTELTQGYTLPKELRITFKLFYANSFSQETNEGLVSLILKDYQLNLQTCKTELKFITCIANMIQQLERLHPFSDGNGRVFSMMLLNLELIKHGLSPCIADNPNFVDLLPLNELVEYICLGQERYELCVNNPSYIIEKKPSFLAYDGQSSSIREDYIEELQSIVQPKQYLENIEIPSLPSMDEIKDLSFIHHLNPQQIKEFCQSIVEVLPILIKSGRDFETLLRYLSPEQRAAVFDNLKDKLPLIITRAEDFESILRYLNLKQRSLLFEEMKDKLSSLIKEGRDVASTLKHLNPEQRTVLYQKIEANLPAIINTREELEFVLKYINTEEKNLLCQKIQAQFSSLMNTRKDLESIFRYLNTEQRTIFFQEVKNKLSSFIKTARDFQSILYFLPEEEKAIFLESIKELFPSLINAADDFRLIFPCLSSEEGLRLLESLKDKLASLITTVEDFQSILKYLNSEQNSYISQFMGNKLTTLIHRGNDFSSINIHIKEELKSTFIQNIGDKLPSLIKTAKDLGPLLEHLSSEQEAIVLETLKERLAAVTKTAKDLGFILDCLTEKQSIDFLNLIKERLPFIITTAKDFHFILNNPNRSPAFVALLFETREDSLALLLKRPEDLVFALRSALNIHSLKKIPRFTPSVENTLIAIIHTEKNVISLLQGLNCREIKILCLSLGKKLLSKINTAGDFICIISNLDDERKRIFFELMMDRLASIIQTVKDLELIVKDLDPWLVTVLLEEMMDELLLVIHTSDDFLAILKNLNPEQRTLLCEGMKDKLPKDIKVEDICKNPLLPTEQRSSLIEAAAKNELLTDLEMYIQQGPAINRTLAIELKTELEKPKANIREIFSEAPLLGRTLSMKKSSFNGHGFFPNSSHIDCPELSAIIHKAQEHLNEIKLSNESKKPGYSG